MYRKSSKPPGGAGVYLFHVHLRGGGGGGFFNLKKTRVSVPHKKQEKKGEKRGEKKFYIIQPRIRIKSDLPVGK